jgi:hypothetical protein
MNIDILYKLYDTPDSDWIIYDLCVENNWALPEYTIPPWLCSHERHVIRFPTCYSYVNFSRLSILQNKAASRLGTLDLRGVLGSLSGE